MKRQIFILNLFWMFLFLIMLYGIYYTNVNNGEKGSEFLIIPVAIFWVISSSVGLLDVIKEKKKGNTSKFIPYLMTLYLIPISISVILFAITLSSNIFGTSSFGL